MNKSIETIWKEGFLQDDALVAPKLNDLYNQKSIHLIDKFERMYKLNHNGLIIFAFIILLISFPIGLQYMGVPMFFIFLGMAILGKKQNASLQHIDKNANSYQYLKSYDNWLKEQTTFYTKIYRYVYPLIFLSVVLGFWFLDFGEENPLGKSFVMWLQGEFPNSFFAAIFPVIGLLLILSIAGLISYFSGRFYQSDLRSIYGNLIDKLEELITDMEELNKG